MASRLKHLKRGLGLFLSFLGLAVGEEDLRERNLGIGKIEAIRKIGERVYTLGSEALGIAGGSSLGQGKTRDPFRGCAVFRFR